MGPEAKLQKKIMAYLKTIPNAIFFKVSQGKYSSHGVSDIIGCVNNGKHRGRLIAIEVKTPTGKATPLQTVFLDRVNAAGGLGFIAISVEGAIERLKAG